MSKLKTRICHSEYTNNIRCIYESMRHTVYRLSLIYQRVEEPIYGIYGISHPYTIISNKKKKNAFYCQACTRA